MKISASQQRERSALGRSSTAHLDSRRRDTATAPTGLPTLVGNQGMLRLLDGGVLQRKLQIGSPNDPLEREADRVSEQVTRREAPADGLITRSPTKVQRKCAACSSGKTCSQCAAEHEQGTTGGGGGRPPGLTDAVAPPFRQDFPEGLGAPRSGPGGTLPYRQATELLECIRIMGEENAASCRHQVLGEPLPPPLSWTHQLRFPHDALWYFCGEHPRGFSTRATLRATGFRDSSQVEWFVTEGADKVYAPGGFRGSEITLRSSAESRRRDDVAIEVRERTRSFTGRLTVRKPHRLRLNSNPDQAACPPWAACTAGCPVYWTQIGYRVLDNVGGTIVGATVNENFPGPKTNDQPNNWVSPAGFITTPFWRNTNGTFIDNWFVFCGNPAPVNKSP